MVAIRSILARWRAPRLFLLSLLSLVCLAPSAPAADDPIGLVDDINRVGSAETN